MFTMRQHTERYLNFYGKIYHVLPILSGKLLKNKTGNPKSSGALFPFMRAQHPAGFLFLNVLLRDVTL